MAIWSLRQMEQVRRTYTRAHVSHEMLEREGEAFLTVTKEKLARQFQELCLPFVVDIHPADLRFTREPADSVPFTDRITAHWHPQTTEVQFFGGPSDGDLRTVPQVSEHIRMAVEQGFDWRSEAPPMQALTPLAVTYALDGWDETARRWVYRSA